MIFPNKDYKEYSFKDFGNKWNEEHNQAVSYCESMPIENYMEFEGKCKDIYLPSFHPYWKIQSEKNFYNSYLRHKEKYQKCLEHTEAIKFEYNITTTIKDIENLLQSYLDKSSNYRKIHNL